MKFVTQPGNKQHPLLKSTFAPINALAEYTYDNRYCIRGESHNLGFADTVAKTRL